MNKKGAAILTFLFAVAIAISALILAVFMFFSIHGAVLNGAHDRNQAFYFANSGIERALYKIRNNDTSSETFTFEGQPITITITHDTGRVYDVISTTIYEEQERTITAKIERDPPNESILLEWSY